MDGHEVTACYDNNRITRAGTSSPALDGSGVPAIAHRHLPVLPQSLVLQQRKRGEIR